jgi:ribonucleoside-diphosphate reductase alpha chain
LNNEMSAFALAIMLQKYAQDKIDGSKETWPEIAYRVAKNVLDAIPKDKREATLESLAVALPSKRWSNLVDLVARLIAQRKFIPGGRYLYASGRPFHQVQNCFEGSTRVVTREGVQEIKDIAYSCPTLMTSEGRWTRAEVKGFGKQPLLKVILSRNGIEKSIFATAGHSWRVARNQTNGRPGNKVSKTTKELKAGDKMWQVFGFGISRTPISPAGIQHGVVFGDGNVPVDEFGFNTANVRLCGEKDSNLIPYFSGYSTRSIGEDTEVSGLPRRFKFFPSIYEDRSYLLGWLAGYVAADGCVSADGVVTLSSADKDNLEFARNVCYLLGIGTFGIRENDRISNLTNEQHVQYSITLMRETLTPEFFLIPEHKQRFENNPPKRRSFWKVESVEETDRVEDVYCAVVPDTHEFVLEDNILTGNCLLMRAEDSREGWADHLHKCAMALMTGAGIGINYSSVRPRGSIIRRTGGFATGPIALMQMTNECGRGIMQGGSRRSAIWAGLNWAHKDIFEFIALKDWSPEVRALKEKDFNFPATMDGTNVSVQLDDAFFEAYHDDEHDNHGLAQMVYWQTLERMLKTAEPGFSVDCGKNSEETLRNACTEVTSATDSDICNLGSINMSRIETLEEMRIVVSVGTLFLLAGTLYSDLPYERVGKVREKNRRLGLGLMGLHEWLLQRGLSYEPNEDLGRYLEIYATSTAIASTSADSIGISRPVKTRAIAPTGSIGILAETSTGIEPLFCVAYKRRYLKGSAWMYQYVVDPTAKRLIDSGIDPDVIEDAYTLAENPERRIAFQAWLQTYVDHAISSTLNLPPWGSATNNEDTVKPFGNMLIKYLPKLRGMTCYPDGARSGQPLTRVKYTTAMKHPGEVFLEAADICDISKGGTCGS